ncbi:hypothetical protein HFO56_23770 [Rhizobium laguerreae]|uniref:hypothetical protein n=1 Tax=Rhizobium laguerreae TaxID=1076926 RepID=UPI001C92208A|nr:hypothetical protein [Rhizobium laguerreae]MBY3155346.1 hypothetical protein [Rhizobium laguerreae]
MRLYHFDKKAASKHSRDLRWKITVPTENSGYKLEEGNVLFDAMREAFDLGFYTHVADIEGDSLHRAFGVTQNGAHPWNRECAAEIHPVLFDPPARNTCAGDIFERDGTFFAVTRYGFNPLVEFAATQKAEPGSPAPQV